MVSQSNGFVVTEKAMRPASKTLECFYCQRALGDEHKTDCVLISKKVKVRMIVEYEIKVPNHWGKEDIEFQRNEGSWCASNAMEELEGTFDDTSCMCGAAEFEYIGGDTEPYLAE
jgi:hypothetical protein